MNKIKKYIAILKYSLKSSLTFLPDYLFSLFSFTIHIFVFNELWEYILQGKEIVGYNKAELMWYIIIAECVTYSQQKSYRKIGEMVRSGDIANMLLKPIDIVNYFLAENSAVIVKGVINIVWAIVLGFIFAGPIEVSAITLVYTVLAVIMGIIIGGLVQTFIGMIAFFTEENQSFYFIIQKFELFVVFTPLDFYPEIVRKFAYWLPTTQMIYVPARLFTKFDLNTAGGLLLSEFLGMVFMYGVLRFLNKKGVEKINLNGG